MNHLYLDTLYAIAKNSNSLSSELPSFPEFKETFYKVLEHLESLYNPIMIGEGYISFNQDSIHETLIYLNGFQDPESILAREVLELLNL